MLYLSIFPILIGICIIGFAYGRYEELGRYPMGHGAALVLWGIAFLAERTSDSLALALAGPALFLNVVTLVAELRDRRRKRQAKDSIGRIS